jgi:uncharacterized membrane protein
MSSQTRLWRFRRDATGSIIPLTAVGLAALCGFAGLGVDLGMVYLEKRRVQSGADLAALAAVRASDGLKAARQSLSDNNYRSPADLVVTSGTYTGDRSVPHANRFSPNGSAPNAARVHLTSTVRTAFVRVIGGPTLYSVQGDATALRADFASFGIGSRLLSLDAGVANAMLSRLLGANITLSLMDYRALASLRVDALGILRGAAPRFGVQAGTYNDVLKGSLSMMDFTALLGQSADRTGGAAALSSLNTLSAAMSGTSTSVRLAGLLTAGDVGATPVSQNGEALWVNALDLITGAAFVANGDNQVGLDLGTSVPGLARARITMRIGDAWRTSGFVSEGTGLSTSQQRILVEVWVPGPTALLNLYIPIFMELAPARAVLRKTTCPWSAASERSVTLDVTTGVSFIAISQVPSSALDLGSPRPPTVPAKILRAPLLTVTGAAGLQIGSSSQTVTFSDDDIRAARFKTVSTTNLATSLTSSLLANLDLQFDGLTVPGVVDPKGAITGALGAAAAPIDTLLFSILNLAGVKIGSADVTVTGTRCGGAVLVQ